MMPVLILGGMILVFFVHPDPKEIGMNLERYYPGYMPPPRLAAGRRRDSILELFRQPTTRLAILSNCAGQGNMAIVMVLTSLVLSHHGHGLTAIAISHSFHAAGMFAFTIPLGRPSDRYGREWVMYPGVGMALVGALFVAFSDGSCRSRSARSWSGSAGARPMSPRPRSSPIASRRSTAAAPSASRKRRRRDDACWPRL